MKTPTLLCAVPARFWSSEVTLEGAERTLQETLADALLLERRIEKGIEASTERKRYSRACGLYEGIVLGRAAIDVPVGDPGLESDGGRFAAVMLDGDYLDFVGDVGLDEGIEVDPGARFGRSCFPPGPADVAGTVAAHLHGLRSLVEGGRVATGPSIDLRDDFLATASLGGCGVVEVQLPFTVGSHGHERTDREPNRTVSAVRVDVGEGSGKKHLQKVVRAQVQAAIDGAGAFLGDGASHDVIVQSLAGSLYASSSAPGCEIPVMYRDNSVAEPFPLRSVVVRPGVGESVTIRAALLSMRHQALDAVVDFNWFRNKVVSQRRAHAATDTLCLQESRAQLSELAEAYPGKHLRIEMYQTGLQPAVIGFYRAVAERLINEPEPRLTVIPMFYLGQRFVPGRPWTARKES